MNVINTTRIKIRTARQDILKEDMMADQKINIQYASKYSNSSNYWKYSIGQNRQLAALDVMQKSRMKRLFFLPGLRPIHSEVRNTLAYSIILKRCTRTDILAL